MNSMTNRSIRMLLPLLLLITVDSAISGKEALSIYACRGESVELFQNIPLNVSETETFLYKNSVLIELWSKSKTEQEEHRLSLDESGYLRMHNVDVSDDATYTVVQTIGGKHPRDLYEVRLIVMVAPAKSCRPQLKRDGNALIASLEAGAACGNPGATTSWLESPFMTLESQTMAKLSPGREAGTYYACIETIALRCERRFDPSDFCSSLTIDESNHHAGSIVSATNIIVISVMGLVL